MSWLSENLDFFIWQNVLDSRKFYVQRRWFPGELPILAPAQAACPERKLYLLPIKVGVLLGECLHKTGIPLVCINSETDAAITFARPAAFDLGQACPQSIH
ncbi:hypothetical protein [Vogesella sp. XCS3]|uniref:hypothetical protein n=1 Tax=Vogesella sp. XCS3 TaxID=2877939 RepID=UPI001D0B11AF|nr:hypothetical protein [Vogesella sp. XCS3]UDM18816.1 hypothetical protein LCH97_09880 [Vogesella sp. XCS3]